MEEKDHISNKATGKEVDLLEIAVLLWARKKFIVTNTAIILLFGLLIAIFTPNEYTATSIMVPQTGEKRTSGGLSGLAAMAGINLGSLTSSEVLSPSIYPKILNNINFQRELIYTKYNIEKSASPVTYYDYSTNSKFNSFNLLSTIKKYTIGLPKLLIRAISITPNVTKDNLSKSSPVIDQLTYTENLVIIKVISNLSLVLNDKDGYISLSYKCREPRLAAEVVLAAQRLLQKYLTEFKLQKVSSNLKFVENSYLEAKRNFEEKQLELARFRDGNVNFSSSLAKTNEEKLTSEYNLLLGIYTEIAKQREQAKIAITETTPILTVVQPVTIPSEKSGPKRLMILVGFTFIGLITGIGIVIIKPSVYNLIKSRYNVNDQKYDTK